MVCSYLLAYNLLHTKQTPLDWIELLLLSRPRYMYYIVLLHACIALCFCVYPHMLYCCCQGLAICLFVVGCPSTVY